MGEDLVLIKRSTFAAMVTAVNQLKEECVTKSSLKTQIDGLQSNISHQLSEVEDNILAAVASNHNVVTQVKNPLYEETDDYQTRDA